MMTAADRKPDAEVTLVRVFDARRDLVWKAWTDPKQLAQWWGPKGFTNPVCEIDVRRGGKIRIDMRAPNGEVYPTTGTFREVDPPSRIVFENAALNQDGDVVQEGFTIVTFEEQGRKTRLIIEAISVVIRPGTFDMCKGVEQGWSESLDRLADLVVTAPAT